MARDVWQAETIGAFKILARAAGLESRERVKALLGDVAAAMGHDPVAQARRKYTECLDEERRLEAEGRIVVYYERDLTEWDDLDDEDRADWISLNQYPK